MQEIPAASTLPALTPPCNCIVSANRDFDNLFLTHALADILDELATLSKHFQDNALSFLDTKMHLDATIDRLLGRYTYVGGPPVFTTNIDALIAKLRSDGLFEGHHIKLDEGEEWSQFSKKWFKEKVFVHRAVTALCENLRNRFPQDDSSLASNFNFLTPGALLAAAPPKAAKRQRAGAELQPIDAVDLCGSDDLENSDDDDFGPPGGGFGEAEIHRLGEHYGKVLGDDGFHLINPLQLRSEWRTVRRRLGDAACTFHEEATKAAQRNAKGASRAAAGAVQAGSGPGPSSAAAAEQAGAGPGLSSAAAAEQAGGAGAAVLGPRLSIREFWRKTLFWLSNCAPNLTRLVQIMLVMTPHSAEVERGFSKMNLIKTKFRSRLSVQSLHALMRIAIEGPPLRCSRHQPDWSAFEADVLPGVMSRWHQHIRVPQRSSHNPRPNRKSGESAT